MTSQDQVPQQYAQPTHQHYPPTGDTNAAAPLTPTPTRKSGWPNVGMILAGALGAVGVFLPIANFFGQTFNWLTPGLSDSMQAEGIFLLVASGLAILLGVFSLLVRRTWARVLAGIIGLLAGGLIAFDGLRNIPTMNELAGSAGTGLYVLAAAGVALVILSLIVLFRRRT